MSELPSLSILDDLLDDAPLPVLWLALLLAAPLLAIPVIIFWIGPGLTVLFGTTLWRQLLLPPLLVIYTVLIVPRLQRLRADVVTGLWPVIDAGERDHEELLREVARRHPAGEAAAIVVGLVLGTLFNVRGVIHYPTVPLIVAVVAFILVWMIGAWIVYYCVQIARSTNRLLELPLTIDLFDLRPFAPIGRLGMAMSLAFFGGILLSLLVGFNVQSLAAPEFWIAYGLLVAVAFGIFFLSMHRTHHLLAATKAAQQEDAEQHLAEAYAILRNRSAPGDGALELAADITAWTAYQRALNETRTWPYNTRALRTLTITVLSPLALGAARLIGILLTAD